MKWISIKTRLPENKNDIWVLSANDNKIYKAWYGKGFDEFHFIEGEPPHTLKDGYNLTHWTYISKEPIK